MLRMKWTLVALACTTWLAACGGGGDDTPAPPDSTVVGLWTGSSSTGVDLDGVVLPDGAFWVVYSSDGGALGLLQGDFEAGSGNFSLPNGVNFNADLTAPQGFSASGSYGTAGISGRAAYSSGVNDTFTLTRQAGYDTPTTLAALQGTWRGKLGMVNDVIVSTFTVAADGSFTGSESLGCRFSGRFTLRPEAKAPVNMTLTLNPNFCDSGDTITGVALPWAGGNQMALAAQMPRRDNAVFGVVSRNL